MYAIRSYYDHKHVKLISKDLGIKFLSTSEKYQGTPLFINRDKTKSFQFLIDKFYSRLSNCKRTNLNGDGRTVITKHVLSSLVVYHMSWFPFPKKITSKIDSIQRTFWWSQKNPRRAAYFRSWSDIGRITSYNVCYTKLLRLNYSKQLDFWYEIENYFYKQKSRIDYFTHYDKNTNFFHNSA